MVYSSVVPSAILTLTLVPADTSTTVTLSYTSACFGGMRAHMDSPTLLPPDESVSAPISCGVVAITDFRRPPAFASPPGATDLRRPPATLFRRPPATEPLRKRGRRQNAVSWAGLPTVTSAFDAA